MQVTSSYPIVATALKQVLLDRFGPEIVARGAPFKRITGKEGIFIGGVEDGTHEFATMRAGRKTRNERYLLKINIRTKRDGAEPVDAEERAFELLSEIEDILSEDPRIGLDEPTLRVHLSEFDMDSFTEDPGWACMIVAKLLVEVRLT